MLSARKFSKLSISLFALIVLLAGVGLMTAEDGAGFWKDDATGLNWAGKDNGMPITPNEGRAYCERLKMGDFSDWRLPTVEEVEAIYDKEKKPGKIKGATTLSEPCVLTSSTTRAGETYTFCFNSGSRNVGGGSGCGTTGLALCVSGGKK